MTEQYTMNPQSVVFPLGPNKRQAEKDHWRMIARLRAENADLRRRVLELVSAQRT